LLAVVEQDVVPRTIVELKKKNPMRVGSDPFAVPQLLYAVPGDRFEKALGSLVQIGVVEEVREDEGGTTLFVRLSEEFVGYWDGNRTELQRLLSYAASAALTRERYQQAHPLG